MERDAINGLSFKRGLDGLHPHQERHEPKHHRRHHSNRRPSGHCCSVLLRHLDGSHVNSRQRIIRIHDRADGRFVTRNDRDTDSPLGVDTSINLALGTAHREAVLTAREEGCTVIVQIRKGARWTEVERLTPPA